MTHMARIRHIFQNAIHFQKNLNKTPNQTHPTNACKTFHWVFERYYSFRKKIKTDAVISRNLQSCTGDWLPVILCIISLSSSKYLQKNLEPFSVLLATRKVLLFHRRFFDSSLFVVNKYGFDYLGFAWLAMQNPGYFQIIYSSCFSSSKRYATQLQWHA